MTLLSVYLVTTVSPSAICSSMVKLMVEKASRISATERLKSSRVGPCPGSRLRSTKSGLSSSSMTLILTSLTSSRKRRTSALLFSSTSDIAPASSLPTPVSLRGRHQEHDATRRDLAHRLEPYSPNLVEGTFSEVQLKGRSPKSSYEVLYSAGLLDRGSDSS